MDFSSTSLLTVEEVCRDNSFVVPEFQRGYAWEEAQWKSLWDDAMNVALRNQRQHYGGAIMISASTNGQPTVELIDGQQRLTSIALMLSALGANGFPIVFRYNEPLQTYYDYYARKQEHLAPRLAQHRSYYARNLARAADYFTKRVEAVTAEARRALVNVLMQRFMLSVLVIESEFDVHVAFETINNRGKPLSTLERLKNRLIYLASNAEDMDAGRSAMAEVHRCWKSVYAWLGAGKILLDDDGFLRAHALGWFKHERKAEWLDSQLFDEEFSAYGAVTPKDITTYVRSLELGAACWYYINEPTDFPAGVARQLAALQRTASASSKPLLLWALIRLATENRKLTVAPAEDESWCRPFEGLICEAERFAVLVVLANGRLSSVGQSDINRSAYALAHPGEPLYKDFPNLVFPSAAPEAVTFAREHLTALIDNWDWETEDYRDERFPWTGHFDCETVERVIADQFRRGAGFYNWQFGKLLIYLWEDFLRGDRGRPEKKPWEQFAWDESVEHIYPQTPHPKWADAITLDGRSSKAMKDSVTNSIGNLLLLSRSRNSALSNAPYQEFGGMPGKKQRYGSGSYSEMQVARLCDNWTVVQIAARGIAMMRLAQKTWAFEVVNDDAKLTEWLPLLFGDQAQRVQGGDYTGGKKVDGRALQRWLERFEDLSL